MTEERSGNAAVPAAPGPRVAPRADHLGSLLRPAARLEARATHAERRISDEELDTLENESILRALALQREVGLEIFSGGEYRRSWFASHLPDSVAGLVPDPEPMTLTWEGEGSALD